MPEVVKDWKFRARRSVYDWNTLLDGQIWRMVGGEDFTCKPESLRTAVYREAKERGIGVNVNIDDGDLYIQAVKG